MKKYTKEELKAIRTFLSEAQIETNNPLVKMFIEFQFSLLRVYEKFGEE